MKDKKDSNLPTSFKIGRLIARIPYYVQLAYGGILLFGLVGTCTGRSEQAGIVFLLTAVSWACIRILLEAFTAWRMLKMLSVVEAEFLRADAELTHSIKEAEEQKKQDKDEK